MLSALTFVLAQAEPIRIPAYFFLVLLSLLGVGALGWLIAAVLGFTRARTFGASTRWFAIASVCLLLYHLQWFVFAVYGYGERSTENVLTLGAFFNLFVVAGAVCAIIGFTRLTNPEP